ncbi:TPA: hypothetical protein HA274_04865, partial [Candidatus Bathyarchaeota archaeon]|nr:hypothetical protein [Candidatus Bathyarchaeota archaeon]
MKKTIMIIAVVLLAMAILATPLVSASPIKDRNNDKFQTFAVSASFNIVSWLTAPHEFIPSEDNVNKYEMNFDEKFITYDITVGSKTYHLGTDFTYAGHVKYTFYDVTAWEALPPPLMWPDEYRSVQVRVDYVFDFSAVDGGLDGTIHMLAIMNNAGKIINSLDGTG